MECKDSEFNVEADDSTSTPTSAQPAPSSIEVPVASPSRMAIAIVGFAMLPILTFVGVVLLGDILQDRRMRASRECLERLTKIDGSIEQWALENNKRRGDQPPLYLFARFDGWLCGNEPHPYEHLSDDEVRFECEFWSCPTGAKYVFGKVGQRPICTSGLKGHKLFVPQIAKFKPKTARSKRAKKTQAKP